MSAMQRVVAARGRARAAAVRTLRWGAGGWESAADQLAVEEPLQIRLNGRSLSVVMRTPGHDLELTLGLLYAEGVLRELSQVRQLHLSAEAGEGEGGAVADLLESNQVEVVLGEGELPPERTFVSSSACGICGAATIEALALRLAPLPPGPVLDPALLLELVGRLRSRQPLFARTGGLHAAALFTASGRLIALREDVGRHNAVDKLVGRMLLDGLVPGRDHVLVVSGRAGFEIVQKAVAAGIPVLAAVGAPTSLAIATARRFGLTVAGFVREGRFNLYSAGERLAGVPRGGMEVSASDRLGDGEGG
jgi:FdhD protein